MVEGTAGISTVSGELLERPHFGARPDEFAWRKNPKLKKKFAFEDILTAVREHPKTWAKIAVYTKGGKVATQNGVRNDKTRVRKWLRTNHPFETWKVSIRTTPDTWYHRELWVRYNGILTPAQAAERDRKSREIGLALANGRLHRLANRATSKMFDNAQTII